MLDIREREINQVKYNNSYDMGLATRPYNVNVEDFEMPVYPEERRATNDEYYNSYRDDSYSYPASNYSNMRASQDSAFTTFNYGEVIQENKKYEVEEEKYFFAKNKKKMETKTKLFIGIYAALITLIVTMLLVNTIPSVGAQQAVAESVPEITVSEEGYNVALSEAVANSSVVTNPPYEYDTTTNWFDDFCDFMGKVFG